MKNEEISPVKVSLPMEAIRSVVESATHLPMNLPPDIISSVAVVEKEIDVFHKWIDREKLVGARGPGYPVIVTCDWHIPHTSPEWMRRLREVQHDRKVPNLVINGDFLDEVQASTYVNVGPQATLKEELMIGSAVLNDLLDYFEKIYIVLGNHDLRLLKMVGKEAEVMLSEGYAKILFGHMIDNRLIDTRVFISNLQWCETQDGRWLMTHPKSYSRGGSIVPVRIAQKYAKNVIGGHGHHLAMAYTDSGRNMGIDGGGMFNEDSMLYKQSMADVSPDFNNGFVLLNEKGEAKLYGEGLE